MKAAPLPCRSHNRGMRLPFTKMQGAGNDFVVLDGLSAPLQLSPEQARHLPIAASVSAPTRS